MSALAGTRRIVVKIGSSLLTNAGAGLDRSAIADWTRQIAALRSRGIEALVRQRHRVEPDAAPGFRVSEPAATIAAQRGTGTTIAWLLAAIASVSLIVGGIGILNIMLVSVRERTREIGLRKAVGARPRDIGLQFLLEAVLLTTTGGVLGMALGIGAALLVDRLSPVPAAVTWWSLALAFGVSALVGIVFGVVPAQRAGRLDPVVALRTE